MTNNNSKSFLRPISIVALCIFIASAAFLPMASELNGNASLLPVAMLVGLMVLSVLLALSDIKDALNGKAASELSIQSPSRALSALLCVIIFIVSVDFVGFYLTTSVFVPVVAYGFGCRSVKILLASDIIVVASIYLIFGMAMSKDFPVGSIW